MTLEEARVELEILAGADADLVRRAYLRKLKRRKPEVDPEGFRRLREALDVVNGRARFSKVQVAMPAVIVSPPQEPASPPPPVAVPRAAPAEPMSPQPPVVETDDLPDLDAWRELAALSLAAAEDTRSGPPPTHDVVESVLGLQSEERFDEARQLIRAFGAYLSQVGEARAMAPALGARWRLAREIDALGGLAPPALLVAFACSAVDDDPDAGINACRRQLRTKPEIASKLAELLRASAPLLAEAYAEQFDARRPVRPDIELSARAGWLMVGTLVGSFCLIVGLVLFQRPRESFRWTDDALATAAALRGDAKAFAKVAARLGHTRIADAAEALADAASEEDCKKMDRSRDALVSLVSASGVPETLVRAARDLERRERDLCLSFASTDHPPPRPSASR